jgi:hypothetical protein
MPAKETPETVDEFRRDIILRDGAVLDAIAARVNREFDCPFERFATAFDIFSTDHSLPDFDGSIVGGVDMRARRQSSWEGNDQNQSRHLGSNPKLPVSFLRDSMRVEV